MVNTKRSEKKMTERNSSLAEEKYVLAVHQTEAKANDVSKKNVMKTNDLTKSVVNVDLKENLKDDVLRENEKKANDLKGNVRIDASKERKISKVHVNSTTKRTTKNNKDYEKNT